MKKIIAMLLAVMMLLTVTGCNMPGKANEEETPAEQAENTTPEKVEEDVAADTGESDGENENPSEEEPKKSDLNVNENTFIQDKENSKNEETEEAAGTGSMSSVEDALEDRIWNELNQFGSIRVENGEEYVEITLPASLVGEDASQEDIDAQAAEGQFISGVLHEDGSATYRMTKAQHMATLKEIEDTIKEGIEELLASGEFSIKDVKYNDNMTVFDVYLSTDYIGFADGYAAMAFYMYGWMNSIFRGVSADSVKINCYSDAGELLKTYDSADFGN